MKESKIRKTLKKITSKAKSINKKCKVTKSVKESTINAQKNTNSKVLTPKKLDIDTLIVSKNICIDYPKNDDTIKCGHYSFRVGSIKPCSTIQISINGGVWQNCRQANGYWWFDWFNNNTGDFSVEAKAYIEGKEEKTSKRKFKVK